MAEIAFPEKLPQLTRVVSLELVKVRKAQTKSVDGVELSAKSFAYVGDPKRTDTWHLPIDFPGDEEKTKSHIRDALSRFNQTEMSDAKKKARAWRRIVAAAKKHGIDVTEEGKKHTWFETPEFQAFRADAERDAADGDPEDGSDDGDDEPDEDRFDMSFSSEAPVPRWFGDEILDHSADCIDMSRASNGLAYLVDHDTGQQVGLIEDFRVENGKTRGTVRFSRSQRAQEIKRDVADKIRPFTSIGYRVNEMALEKEEKSDSGDTHRTYRVTKWTPMEGSTVAVPADTSVGAGRSAGKEEFPVSIRSTNKSTSEVRVMSEVATLTPKDSAEIIRLCSTHGLDNKRAAEIIEKAPSVDAASRMILEDVAKRDGSKVQTAAAEHTDVVLTEREQREYSICRGIMTHVRRLEDKRGDFSSFETEVSDEIAKRHEGKSHGGLFIPYKLRIDEERVRAATELLKRAGISTALTAGTSTKGQELVFTEPGPFIQFLYNRMRLKELGAEVMSGLQGNVALPKQTGRATGSWVAENPGVDVADSNLTLSQVTLTPHTYQTSASYSRQLLAQAVIDIDNLVRSDLARDAALAIDLAGIAGTGSSNQPTGILHASGVQSYVNENDASNGAKPTWDDVTLMEELIEDQNADQLGDPAWLTTPGIKSLFKRSPVLLYNPPSGSAVNVTGSPIWSADDEIDGHMARQSNQVPSNLSRGSSSGDVHALILGVFNTMVNGLWGSGFELVVDPYRLKKQGLIELTTFILTDWEFRYPVAFVANVSCLKSGSV